MTKAAIFVESQPPHAGEIATVLYNIDKYDFVYICVYGKPTVMQINHVRALWSVFLKAYSKKVAIMALSERPEEITKALPIALNDCELLTTSKKAFVRLSTIHNKVKLVPRTLGYHGTFIRTAYRQSRALDWLQNNNATTASNVDNKKVDTKVGEKNEK